MENCTNDIVFSRKMLKLRSFLKMECIRIQSHIYVKFLHSDFWNGGKAWEITDVVTASNWCPTFYFCARGGMFVGEDEHIVGCTIRG